MSVASCVMLWRAWHITKMLPACGQRQSRGHEWCGSKTQGVAQEKEKNPTSGGLMLREGSWADLKLVPMDACAVLVHIHGVTVVPPLWLCQLWCRGAERPRGC